jgi:hypothetical protein
MKQRHPTRITVTDVQGFPVADLQPDLQTIGRDMVSAKVLYTNLRDTMLSVSLSIRLFSGQFVVIQQAPETGSGLNIVAGLEYVPAVGEAAAPEYQSQDCELRPVLRPKERLLLIGSESAPPGIS